MNRVFDRRILQTKALLCVVLTLNVQFWIGGCGFDAATLELLSGGTLRIELTPEHPLAIALRGTAFADARAIEIDPAVSTFRVIFPEAAREMLGKYAYAGGAPTITELHVAAGPASATVELNTAKHVTRLSSGYGQVWVTPAQWLESPLSLTGANGYERANAPLLAFARQLDGGAPPDSTGGSGSGGATANPASGAATGSSDPLLSPSKAGQAAFGPTLALCSLLTSIWEIHTIVLTLTIIFAALAALQSTTDPTGACCVETSCTVTTQANCSGMWTSGADCNATPCPTGACCLPPSGMCELRTLSDCLNSGGDYHGDGTPCTPTPCFWLQY